MEFMTLSDCSHAASFISLNISLQALSHWLYFITLHLWQKALFESKLQCFCIFADVAVWLDLRGHAEDNGCWTGSQASVWIQKSLSRVLQDKSWLKTRLLFLTSSNQSLRFKIRNCFNALWIMSYDVSHGRLVSPFITEKHIVFNIVVLCFCYFIHIHPKSGSTCLVSLQNLRELDTDFNQWRDI